MNFFIVYLIFGKFFNFNSSSPSPIMTNSNIGIYLIIYKKLISNSKFFCLVSLPIEIKYFFLIGDAKYNFFFFLKNSFISIIGSLKIKIFCYQIFFFNKNRMFFLWDT